MACLAVVLAISVEGCAIADRGPETPIIIGPTDLAFPSETDEPIASELPSSAGPTTAASPGPSGSAVTAIDPWSVPFLTRPASQAIYKKGGCDGIVIQGLSFADLGEGVEAIHLEKCNGVTIRANDFARVAQAITLIDVTDVKIEWNRYQDILGPHARAEGIHRANFIQLVRSSRGRIAHNKGKGGDTEDIVSLFQSGGTKDHPFIVEDNHFEGTDWTSSSGSGIALGDATSGYSIARNNTLLNPGQAGIFIAGGTNHSILDNVVYGAQRPGSNVGIYVWNQSEEPCSDNVVRGNQVNWTKADGSDNPGWDGGNCGTIKGWEQNDWNAPIDPATLQVTL